MSGRARGLAGALAGAAALPLARSGYERLQTSLADRSHDWLPTGFLLWRPFTVDVALALAFLLLAAAVLLAPERARKILGALLVLLALELPIELALEAFLASRRGLTVDLLSTLAPLPACALALLLLFRLRQARPSQLRDVAFAWALVFYAGTMAKPGAVAF